MSTTQQLPTVKEYLGCDDVLKLHGMGCIAIKDDTPIYGMISVVENDPRYDGLRIFICSEERTLEGSHTNNNFGFPYTWVVQLDKPICSYNDICSDGLQALYIIQMENLPEDIRTKYGFKSVVLNKSYTATCHPGFIKVGCQEIPNESIIRLYNNLMDDGKSHINLTK